MQDFIIEVMNQYGAIGIAILIAVENIFPPIPSEVILSFGGFMTTYTSLSMIEVVTASTIGSVVGAIMLYGFGRILNKDRLIRICEGKFGRAMHLKTEDIENSERWFSKNENAVWFCRCIPIVRSLISVPAGMNKMKLSKFIVLTTIGTLIWNILITGIGKIAGNSWNLIDGIITKYTIGLIIIGAFIFLLMSLKKWKR